MANTVIGRRSLLQSATILAAGAIASSPATQSALGQGVPGNAQYGVKALFFDMFGTVLDWRTGVARSAEAILKPRGYSLDWLAFVLLRRSRGPGVGTKRTWRHAATMSALGAKPDDIPR
jgi:2-haloacid dehalogenase